MGDGILIEFPSVVEAVGCAIAVQQGLAERNDMTPESQQIVFRIGINVGDVIIEDDDIYGDGVNLAARIQTLAEPGGICVSRTARDQIRDKLDIALKDMGEHEVKNIARPVRVFRVPTDSPQLVADKPSGDDGQAAAPNTKVRPSIAVLPFENMSSDPEQEFFRMV